MFDKAVLANALLVRDGAQQDSEGFDALHPPRGGDGMGRVNTIELGDILDTFREALNRFIESDEPPTATLGFLRPIPSPAVSELREACVETIKALEKFTFGPDRNLHDVQEKIVANQLQSELMKFHQELKDSSTHSREMIDFAIDVRAMLGNVEVQLDDLNSEAA